MTTTTLTAYVTGSVQLHCRDSGTSVAASYIKITAISLATVTDQTGTI